ncbi:MAG: cytochrome c-type biogenesis protein CcmH [Steroidobacteraceae bacterium]|nr:cytochrome c-type biogenesis protein CcmH [Steroidobacteraceae bacterium]
MLLLTICAGAFAVDTTLLPNEALQKRYDDLTHELRCMQCQNQSIADSPVDLAAGLRRDVKEQLIAGRTDGEIRESMVRRYGNAILFRPPLDSETAWVWIAPVVALLGGFVVAVVIVRRRSALVDGDDSLPDDPSQQEPR